MTALILDEKAKKRSMAKRFAGEITPYIPLPLKEEISAAVYGHEGEIEEIRFRLGSPISFSFSGGKYFLASGGGLTDDFRHGRILNESEMRKTVLLISGNSFYALEEELRRGYITLPGGHRAGLCGRAVLKKGALYALKEISAVNIRVAHCAEGAADELLPLLFSPPYPSLNHTLIISPPGAGKTTLLRDIAGLLGGKNSKYAYNVSVVDERCEIAAACGGMPQLTLGPRCDVLSACPKAEGIMLMLRSMCPQVIICDEIGRREDVYAVWEALNAGVTIIASAHGRNPEEIKERPALKSLLKARAFGRLVFLSRRLGPGTIEAVLDASLRPVKEKIYA